MRHSAFLVASFSLTALLVSGCFTPKKEEEIRGDIFSLQTRLLAIERNSKDKSQDTSTRKQVAVTQTELERMSNEIQQLKGEIDGLKIAVATGRLPGADPEKASVGKRLDDLAERVEGLEAGVAAAPEPEAPTAAAKPKTTGIATSESLADLQTLFQQKKFTQVSEQGPAVLTKLKGKEQESGLFLVAESLFKLGKLRDAALKYNDLIEKFPSSPQLAQSKMRMGDCFRHLGDQGTAKLYYQDLVSKHPGTEQATKAKERLNEYEKSGAGANRATIKKKGELASSARAHPKTGKKRTGTQPSSKKKAVN